MAAITCQFEDREIKLGLWRVGRRKSLPQQMARPRVSSCGNLDSFSVSLGTQ